MLCNSRAKRVEVGLGKQRVVMKSPKLVAFRDQSRRTVPILGYAYRLWMALMVLIKSNLRRGGFDKSN